MSNDIPSDLSDKIANGLCVLFIGAGATCDSGGKLWKGLVSELKKRFKYSSPLKDLFEIMGDMCSKFGEAAVYDAIKDILKNARPSDSLLQIAALPWHSTFTTNYDSALETALSNKQNRQIRIVLTGNEFELSGISSTLICVKLMGSMDVPYGDEGAMIVSPGDLGFAKENRQRVFDGLAAHAANLSFLFMGYSFNDKLFIDILEKLDKVIGPPRVPHYALFPEDLPADKKYLLESRFKINPIIKDIDIFAEEISKMVSLRNPKDFTNKALLISTKHIPIRTTDISGFLSRYDLVLSERVLKEYVNITSFLKGETKSLNPFNLGWHYRRDEIDEIIGRIKGEQGDNIKIVAVKGNSGSGRTFTICGSVCELITKHGFIAIQISKNSARMLPGIDEMNNLIKAVKKASDDAKIKCPTQIVFWSEFPLADSEIAQFLTLANAVDNDETYQVKLICEALDTATSRYGHRISYVDVDIDITSKIKISLTDYIMRTIDVHQLQKSTRSEITKIIEEEKRFLPIIYRTLDPSRRSINNIIAEEFKKIDDVGAKQCLALCCLATFLGIKIPLIVLKNALARLKKADLSYKDVFTLIDKASVFIREFVDSWDNIYFEITHLVVAKQLLGMLGVTEADKMLLILAESSDISSPTEAYFIRNVFIDEGIRRYLSHDEIPFSFDGLDTAFKKIIERQPARPLLHHLARLYEGANINDERIVPLLERALDEPSEKYEINEKRGNVQTTLANVLWKQNRDVYAYLPKTDLRIKDIIVLLRSARLEDPESVHTYFVELRILRDLVRAADNAETKLELVHEGIDIARSALDLPNLSDENIQNFNGGIVRLLAEIDEKKAEQYAAQLSRAKNGAGYYTLALYEYHKNQDIGKTHNFLDKALECETYPGSSLAFKIELLFRERIPDYTQILKYVDRLSLKLDYSDSWKSAYHKAVCYIINGFGLKAVKNFQIADRLAPRYLEKRVQLFWMDKTSEKRKVFSGKISLGMTEREGRIYNHNIRGFDQNVFFNPAKQLPGSLTTGLMVDFELGFSPRGPIAFDVRPHIGK
jgi:hypothetical protein